MINIAPYLKAVVGALIAGLSALGAFLINDTALSDITAGQWVAVAIAFLVALGAVFAVPNQVPPA